MSDTMSQPGDIWFQVSADELRKIAEIVYRDRSEE